MDKRIALLFSVLCLCCRPLGAMMVTDTLDVVTAPCADSITLTTGELADRIIEEAGKYLGTPYRLGGRSAKAFDCSNFTSHVYEQFGITLSGNAIMQATQGREVKGPISNLQKGDILIFGSRRNVNKVGHVALYIEPDSTGNGFYFIHAAVHGGIKISNSRESYYVPRYLGARRLLPDINEQPVDTLQRDTLQRETVRIESEALRCVLYADGTWMYVDSLGVETKPVTDEKIILEADGRWSIAPKAPVQSAKPKASPLYHKVKTGETLYGIAHKYHTTVNAICRLNGIKSSTPLKTGKRLRIK